MTYVRPARRLITCATILLLAFTLSCGVAGRRPERDGVVWFVQVTDPNLFLDTSKDADAAKKSVREKQEKLDQSAMSDLWKQLPSLTNEDRPLSFLVMTGDFGIEPCSIADISTPATSTAKPKAADCLEKVNKVKRDSQITVMTDLLGASPVRDIYLIPGNNDIPFETAGDDGLAYFNQFIDEVQKKIDDSKKNVQLHNLSRCYLNNGGASTCYADISDTPYRMIGFPSYSYKNREPGSDSNSSLQEKQFETFRSLLDAARQAGKRVLILTHVPLIDDPFTLAQDRYAGVSPPAAIDKDPNNARSVWSTWNVSKKLADEWEETVASDSVAGVLAGHLHDSHKEIYQSPYLWSTANDHKTGFSKLYLAPPLSVKNQDASPIQARGFSLVGLDSGQIRYSIYWYNSETHDFVPDRASRFQRERRGHWKSWQATTRTVTWLWQLAESAQSLDRMAVLLIAFVAAFLTVVQVWQIPSPDNPKTKQEPEPTKGEQDDAGKNKAGASKSDYEPSPFASNFGKTVIMGLGGLAAETVLKTFENKPSANDKEFYVVWFVIFFFLILVLGALVRALGEAVRERISIVHLKYLQTAPPFPDKQGFWVWFRYWISRAWKWIGYWVLRATYWLLSLRSTLLVFLDTFLNLIQGKNQTLTQVFSKTIIDQQRNMICVAQTVRTSLNDVIRQRLLEKLLTSTNTTERYKILERIENPRNIRVNISVMSADQSRVFYIATAPGSANDGFTKRSVAWVSVFTGKIRWYKRSYSDDKDVFKDIVLFNNKSGAIPGDEETIYLRSHYQLRDDDYEAFVMFPLPWPRRGSGSGAVKGAVHISFSKQEDFERIWKFPLLTDKDEDTLKKQMPSEDWQKKQERDKQRQDKAKADQDKAKADADKAKADDMVKANHDPVLFGYRYEFEERMLGHWCDDAETLTSLRQAVTVLGQLLQGFNENIYLSSKKNDQCSGG